MTFSASAFSDEVLVNLASPGLLRRARKDLEKAPPRLVREEGGRAVLELPEDGVTVEVPAEGPGAATCTCPSRECCRHILAACLFVRERVGDEAEVGVEEAGTLDGGESAEVVAQERAGDGGTVAGERGSTTAVEGPSPASPASSGAPKSAPGAARTRSEVARGVARLLEEMTGLGFSRLSEGARQRLVTLAPSARGANLPRLEKVLRVLAEEVERVLRRDVAVEGTRIMGLASEAYMLSTAIVEQGDAVPEALIGSFRTRYDPVPGRLRLVGLGARGWATDSGYSGLTVFFWCPSLREWFTWTEARPAYYGSVYFDPADCYRKWPMWDGAAPPRDGARSVVLVRHATRNADGRLSTVESTHAEVEGPTDPVAADLEGTRFDDWLALAERVDDVGEAGGRRAGVPVVVVPSRWGEARYDELKQRLVRPIFDGRGRPLWMTVAYGGPASTALDLLAGWDPERFETWGVMGHVRITGARLELDPSSLLGRTAIRDVAGSRIVNLGLDHVELSKRGRRMGDGGGFPPHGPQARGKSEVPAVPSLPVGEPSPGSERGVGASRSFGATDLAPGALEQLLDAAGSLLEGLAEAGTAASRRSTEERLGELAQRLRECGATLCADVLRDLGERLEARRRGEDAGQAAASLLRASFVLRWAAERVQSLSVVRRLAAWRGTGESK